MSLVIYFLPVRVNVDTLARFWNALRNYAGVVAANTVISLPPNVNWLSFPEAPTKLFVRKAYLDLVGILFGSTSMLRYCVLGTPGTGKTYFFYYLLLWCAQNKRNVVAALPSPLIYLVFEGASDHVEALTYPPVDLLMDRSTILLADSITPVPANGPIVLTTSPRKEIFQSFIRREPNFCTCLCGHLMNCFFVAVCAKFKLAMQNSCHASDCLFHSALFGNCFSLGLAGALDIVLPVQ